MATPGAAVSDRVPSLPARLFALFGSPSTAWADIAREPASVRGVYLRCVAPLAAIGPVAAAIGVTMVGVDAGAANVRASVPAAVAAAIVAYALSFPAVALLAWLLNRMTPPVAGVRDRTVALRLVAYSLAPAWIAGIAAVVPSWSLAGTALGLYGAFLLYVGLRAAMQCIVPEALLVTIVASAVAFVFSLLPPPIAGFANGMLGLGSARPGVRDHAHTVGTGVSLLATAGLRSTASDRANAGDSIDTLGTLVVDLVGDVVSGRGLLPEGEATAHTAASKLALLAAGGKRFPATAPDALARLLPPEIEGMKRASVSAGVEAPMLGLRLTVARARYESAGSHIVIEVGDAGEWAGILRAVARFDPALVRTTGFVTERSGYVGGRFVREKYDGNDRSGLAGVMIDDRFAYSARGSGVSLEQLRRAVDAVDGARIAALATTR